MTIAGPVFFLRKALNEARERAAGFPPTSRTGLPRDKLPKLAGKGEVGVGGDGSVDGACPGMWVQGGRTHGWRSEL